MVTIGDRTTTMQRLVRDGRSIMILLVLVHARATGN